MSSEWVETTLGEVCAAQNGAIQTGPFGSQLHASDYVETGIPVVMPSNIGPDGGISEDGIARIKQEDADRLSQHKLQIGDVVFSRRGDVTRNALIEPHQVGWLCGTGCLKVRLGDERKADAKFISYCLRLPETKEWLIRHAVGATMPNLNTAILSAVPIQIPPISEQKKITNLLRALDDRIALLRDTNITLEAIAQALFKSWFVDFDPVHANAGTQAPSLPAEIQALFPSRLVESPQGLIPEGWEVIPFLEACELQGGSQPPAKDFVKQELEGYVRLLQIRDFSTNAHVTYIPDTKKLKKTTVDDVLIGRYGSASGDREKDSLGRVCRGLAGAYNVALMKLVPKKIGRELAFQLVSDPRFYNYLQGVSSKAVQSGFSKSELANYSVVVPSHEVSDVFENLGLSNWNRIRTNNQQMQTLSELRDTLLPRLISGRLRLPEAEATLAEVI